MRDLFYKILRRNNSDLEGVEYSSSLINKRFEDNLKKKFLLKSTDSQVDSTVNLRFLPGWQLKKISLFTLIFIVSITIFILNTNTLKVNADKFNEILTNNPQSALMPIFSRLYKYNSNEIDLAMNISLIPFGKREFSSKTTTNITYGKAFDECNSFFKFNKEISKIITYELFQDSKYKFKTHIFNDKNSEIDTLIYDGKNYFSSKRELIQKDNLVNIKKIESYIPNNFKIQDNNSIVWEDIVNCNNKKINLINQITYDYKNIKSFSIFLEQNGKKELVYDTTFQVTSIIPQELN